MTYIEIINHFWAENRINRCDTYEIALFCYILNEANKQRWPEQIKISTNILTAELGISRKTLINTRKKLKEKKLINFIPGVKNKQTSIYTMYVSTGNIQGNIEGNIQGNIEGNIQGNHLNKNKNKNKIIKEIMKEDPLELKKIKIADDVFLTVKEKDKLISDHGIHAFERMIEILSNYKGNSGRKYKSDYKAILTWVVEKYQKENPPIKIGKKVPVI